MLYCPYSTSCKGAHGIKKPIQTQVDAANHFDYKIQCPHCKLCIFPCESCLRMNKSNFEQDIVICTSCGFLTLVKEAFRSFLELQPLNWNSVMKLQHRQVEQYQLSEKIYQLRQELKTEEQPKNDQENDQDQDRDPPASSPSTSPLRKRKRRQETSTTRSPQRILKEIKTAIQQKTQLDQEHALFSPDEQLCVQLQQDIHQSDGEFTRVHLQFLQSLYTQEAEEEQDEDDETEDQDETLLTPPKIKMKSIWKRVNAFFERQTVLLAEKTQLQDMWEDYQSLKQLEVPAEGPQHAIQLFQLSLVFENWKHAREAFLTHSRPYYKLIGRINQHLCDLYKQALSWHVREASSPAHIEKHRQNRRQRAWHEDALENLDTTSAVAPVPSLSDTRTNLTYSDIELIQFQKKIELWRRLSTTLGYHCCGFER